MYKISIVIPIYRRWDLASELLRGLHRHEKHNIDEVVIVDDNSKDQDVNAGIEVLSKILPITVLQNEENIGFTLSSNRGLEYASRNFAQRGVVFLISSDVSIFGEFIEQSIEILDSPRRTLLGHKLLSHDTGWNTFDGRTFGYLEGYFLACTPDGWRDLGYFDPNYAPYDFEDVDISQNARSRGYKLIPLNSPVIKHLGGGSIGYNPDRQKITERNREYFRYKWCE